MAKMALKCNECGKAFRVSDSNPDPQCPRCNSVDFEVEGVIRFYRPAKPVSPAEVR
jgi:Zn finger protein HypA/HybF involved in hydrogenase expression